MNSRFSIEELFFKMKVHYTTPKLYSNIADIELNTPTNYIYAEETSNYKDSLKKLIEKKQSEIVLTLQPPFRQGIMIKILNRDKLKCSFFSSTFVKTKKNLIYIKNRNKTLVTNMNTARTLIFINNFCNFLSPKNWAKYNTHPPILKSLHKNNEWAEKLLPFNESYKNMSLKQFENYTNARMFLSNIHPLFPRLLQLKSDTIFKLISFFEMFFPMQQLTASIIDSYVNIIKVCSEKPEIISDAYWPLRDNIKILIGAYLSITNKSKETVDEYIINDYFSLCKQLNVVPLITSYKKLKEDHDKYSKEILYGKLPEIKAHEKFKILKEINEIQINYIDTKEKLIEEAVAMKHCVGGYAQAINDGHCGIYGIKYNGERYTLELGNGSSLIPAKIITYIRQLKGRFNAEPPNELVNIIQQQLDLFNKNFARNKKELDE